MRGGLFIDKVYNFERRLSVKIYTVIWKDQFVEKLAVKHGVEIEEVEEVLFIHPHVRLFEKGRIKGENLYAAYG